MDDTAKNVWDVVFGALQFIGVVVGAFWVFTRFRREGPNQPRIEFTIACRFLGPVDGEYVAAFEIYANNKGYVEHRFTEIRLKVLGIKHDEKLSEWRTHEPRLYFPTTLVRGVNLVPEELEYYFVRPGVDQSFSFVTRVPAEFRFLAARATFKYRATGDIHTSERVFEVTPVRHQFGEESPNNSFKPNPLGSLA